MKRTMLWIALVGLIAVGMVSAREKQTAQSDSLQGNWALTSVELNAQVLSMEKLKDARLTVKDTQYTLQLGDIGVEMTHVLHADQQPKAMDLTIAAGPDKGKTFRAIYKLEDDTLTVCRSIKPDVERPTKFATAPESGLMLVVWKRTALNPGVSQP
jgi:uncharacterized protein (TIGR03067 family)